MADNGYSILRHSPSGRPVAALCAPMDKAVAKSRMPVVSSHRMAALARDNSCSKPSAASFEKAEAGSKQTSKPVPESIVSRLRSGVQGVAGGSCDRDVT
ncbi:MAG: hypothetical protein LBT40_18155 [Deltaproteobacteria bacterium]|nr:hypothetical protein [Deltaproteobacteria bacterium]